MTIGETEHAYMHTHFLFTPYLYILYISYYSSNIAITSSTRVCIATTSIHFSPKHIVHNLQARPWQPDQSETQ